MEKQNMFVPAVRIPVGTSNFKNKYPVIKDWYDGYNLNAASMLILWNIIEMRFFGYMDFIMFYNLSL